MKDQDFRFRRSRFSLKRGDEMAKVRLPVVTMKTRIPDLPT